MSDDEWEFEYDETETEDLYITIDLSNVPNAQIPRNTERRPGHPTFLRSRLRALNAARGQVPGMTIDGDAEAADAREPATMGEVQITGLHTPNPLLMYNDQLLSCQWTSTIGTDMFFTKRDAGPDNVQQPLRSLPAVDLLSLGTAKLVAKVGRLRPRDDVIDDEVGVQPSNSSASVVVDGAVATTLSPVVPQEQQATASTLQPTSTGFLSRLNQAKARRGEASRLVVTRASGGSRLVSEHVDTGRYAGEGEPDDTLMGGT
jgi:hypothetical protein